jgi:tetratricopeptide (TPR) repeat protein
MTPELWQRLKPLFEAAVALPREQRQAYIEQACQGDPEAKRELTALMEAHEQKTEAGNGVTWRLQRAAADALLFFQVGDVIDGRFEVVAHLGGGGMGDVYEAYDRKLKESIALKTIRSEIAGDGDILARFCSEVALARRVTGPNVCRIHELFVLAGRDGAPDRVFFTMELLRGQTLADCIAKQGVISRREAHSIADGLCAGLTTIHSEGILHRDLKCRNVMLVERNGMRCAVLMDFGLAREIVRAKSDLANGITVPGTILGTPGYMAPEQYLGNEVSPATDIYALGVVLHEMVTGESPFPAAQAMQAAMLRSKPSRPASSIQRGLPRRWDRVIGKCLEYEAEKRYQSAAEVSRALSRRWPGLGLTGGENRARIRMFATVAALALAILCAGVFLLWPKPTARRDPTALDWYRKGTEQLHNGAYFQASQQLKLAVDRDPTFAVAHARLAEAYAELDSTAAADLEMVKVDEPESKKNLSEVDKTYIEAVRATLLYHFDTAVTLFDRLSKELPAEERGQGLTDLGRAQEKAQRIEDAIRSYQAAAAIPPENPAIYVHLGMLLSKKLDVEGAEAAFQKAEDLYRAQGSNEGRAEVELQRALAANDRVRPEQVKANLERCRQLAETLPKPDIQLQIRTLIQLATAEYFSDQDDAALKDASTAAERARANHLDELEGEALVREGQAYIDKGEFALAEQALTSALHLTENNEHARLKASAQMSLAILRDQQGRPADQIRFAQESREYYEAVGSQVELSQLADLYVRGLEGKGLYTQALESGMEALRKAESHKIDADIMNAKANVGNTLLDMQRYPEAVPYFEDALKISRSTGQDVPFHTLHLAGALWRLGRYPEAESRLKTLSKSSAALEMAYDLATSEMRLSQLRYGDALRAISHDLEATKDSPPGIRYGFYRVKALAELGLRRNAEAMEDAQKLPAIAQDYGNQELASDANLVQAKVLIEAGHPESARPLAEQAYQHAVAAGEFESEWMSQAVLAEIANKFGDATAASNSAKKAIDIIEGLAHAWGSGDYDQYVARFDVRDAKRDLKRLAKP